MDRKGECVGENRVGGYDRREKRLGGLDIKGEGVGENRVGWVG